MGIRREGAKEEEGEKRGGNWEGRLKFELQLQNPAYDNAVDLNLINRTKCVAGLDLQYYLLNIYFAIIHNSYNRTVFVK